jgi:hypothetical protein
MVTDSYLDDTFRCEHLLCGLWLSVAQPALVVILSFCANVNERFAQPVTSNAVLRVLFSNVYHTLHTLPFEVRVTCMRKFGLRLRSGT